MNQELEEAQRELRLAEQAIYKDSLQDRDLKIRDLESEVKYLRRLLNDMLAVPKLQAAPAAAGARIGKSPLPRRWLAQ